MKDKQYGELAEKYFEQARVIFSQPLVEQGDRGIALVNINLGIMSRRLGDLDEGLRRLEDGRDRLRKLGEMGYLAEALDELGLVYMEMGKLRKAQDYLKESLQIALEYTDKYRFGSVVVDICKVHYLNSDYPGLENCAATWEEKLLEWGIQRYTYVWAKFNYLRGMGHWAAGHFLNGLRYLSAAAMAGFNATQLRPSRITPWINTWRFWKVTISSRKNWR
ncbi:MAG: tetratricopeptide repeat protein [Chloroflexi bacterium]|nr:tetratricopeptide repeat protein [Chloroflexota bacterium]